MGNIKKELRKLVLPVLIDMALVMLVGAIDTIMLSQHSDNAVAAVGVGNQLMNIIFLIYQFVSMGVAIICAQYIGAKLYKRLTQVMGIAILVNLVIGGIISYLLWVGAVPILHLMGLRDELMPDGTVYLKITGALSFAQAISLTFSASLRSADKTIHPMVVTAIANAINVVGNYALIFGHWGAPAMGVEGAAWATAISRIVAMILLIAIHTKVHIHSFPLRYFRPFPWSELKNLLRIGIPAMSEELSYCMSQLVITYFINQISTEALTTRTYCATAITFVCISSASVVQGGDILVGHFVGQLRYRAAYILGNYIYRISLIASLVVSGILALSGHFMLGALTDNSNIIVIGTWVFIIDWFLSIGRVGNIFACGTLRATGDAVYPVIIGVIFQWSIAVGFSYVLGIPLGFGLIGMWIGFALDENVRGIILCHRWHSQRWRGKGFVKKVAD